MILQSGDAGEILFTGFACCGMSIVWLKGGQISKTIP